MLDELRSPLGIRGVLEAFYGSFYTFPQRLDMVRFLGDHDFNLYIYGPKNDRQHRMRWRDPYPPAVMAEFGETIWVGRESGVTFCYCISFGVPMNYASEEDFQVVVEKFAAFYEHGCRSFGVLFDDLSETLTDDVNRRRYRSVAEAHADVSNRLYAWGESQAEPCSFYICPTEYYGTPPFGDYLHDLGRNLRPEIEVLYTGPAICSPTIDAAEVRAFGEATGRPPVIWDNYPANDLQMRPEMHVGPLRGRSADLATACRGVVSNLMNQPEASKISLLTIAEYEADPAGYDPEAAWERALRKIGGEEAYPSLRCFAENSLGSCLQKEDAPEMDRLVRSALAELEGGEQASSSEAVSALLSYFDVLDEASYYLKNRLRNLALRGDLLPWIEALDEKFWMGRGALRCLKALDAGIDYRPSLKFMDDLLTEIRLTTKRVGGSALFDLAEFVHRRIAEVGVVGTDGATPVLGAGFGAEADFTTGTAAATGTGE